MMVATSLEASDQGEAPGWAWPVEVLLAWLAALLGYIVPFKRARRFKPNWRDNGQDFEREDSQIQFIPPSWSGGRCPRTPFAMNFGFLALAR